MKNEFWALPGAKPIRIPGEGSAAVRAQNLRAGIPAGQQLPENFGQLTACQGRPIDQG
jgi:LDH2 family malate/lactate/ureidoglycolate dehydrogenase